MGEYTLYSEQGRSMSFDLDDNRRMVNLEIDWVDGETTLQFTGELPDHNDAADLPPEIAALVADTHRRVCGYRAHCEVCYCDDDGLVTCERRC